VPAGSRSAAQYFKDQQTNTITPHGKILSASVREQEGKICYQTEDGKNWSVTPSQRPDGSYQYGTPEKIK
jgi:hypothetical protein